MLWLQKQMLSFHAMASKARREHLVPFITVTVEPQIPQTFCIQTTASSLEAPMSL